MALSQSTIQEIARELIEAERKRKPLEPISQRYGELSYDEAYAIQKKTAEIKIASGAVIVGRKIGLTSKAMQEQSKINEPDYGVVFSSGVFREGQVIDMKKIVWHRIEA